MIWLYACAAPGPASLATAPRGVVPEVELAGPVLKRLTRTQYENTLHDLLGAGILVPDDLEPDAASNGLLLLGGTVNSLSAVGVEQYESAAFDVAHRALVDPTAHAALVACTAMDEACTRATLGTFGRRAWRRPLTPEELDRITAIATTAGTTLGTWDEGLEFGLAAIVESPFFLYRVEMGEDDPDVPGGRRYTSWEMATRLSFFLWDTTPDDTLLAAAEAGDLVTDAGLDAQVDRMLADPRAHQGVRAFFDEMLTLYQLEDLSKDPALFVHMSEHVGPSARQETLALAEWLAFDEDADYRDFYTTTTTFLDTKLAAIYAVPAPSVSGSARTELPEDGGRRGFLGQVSFLALQAHPTSTSPTLRGMFVREVLLCTPLALPPANVDTSIPASSADEPTMRDRLEVHVSDPSCAACHLMTDPIGLGFETFDGLGGSRDAENGYPIDPSGDLDGVAFSDALDFAGVLHEHARLGPCFAETMYQYGTGHATPDAEAELVDWHARGFAENGYRIQWLLGDIVASPAFRRVGASG